MRNKPIAPGHTFKRRGWTILVVGNRKIKVTDPTNSSCQFARIAEDGTITYTDPELVPREVRTAVKVLGRQLLARGLQS